MVYTCGGRGEFLSCGPSWWACASQWTAATHTTFSCSVALENPSRFPLELPHKGFFVEFIFCLESQLSYKVLWLLAYSTCTVLNDYFELWDPLHPSDRQRSLHNLFYLQRVPVLNMV